MFPGPYIYSFFKIGSVTAEILLTLSFCGVVGGGGVVRKVIFVSNPTKVLSNWGWVELWLSWGFDNWGIMIEVQECVIKYTEFSDHGPSENFESFQLSCRYLAHLSDDVWLVLLLQLPDVGAQTCTGFKVVYVTSHNAIFNSLYLQRYFYDKLG